MTDESTPIEIVSIPNPQEEGRIYISGLSLLKDDTEYRLRYLYSYEVFKNEPARYEYKDVSFATSKNNHISTPLPLDEPIKNPRKYLYGLLCFPDFSDDDKAALKELLTIANDPFKLLFSDTWLFLLQNLPAFGAGEMMNRLELINAERGEKRNFVYRAVRLYAPAEIRSFKKKNSGLITLEDFYSHVVPACIEKTKKRDSYRQKKTGSISSHHEERAETKEFYNVPTSPATDTILRVLGTRGEPLTSPENAEAYIEQSKKVNHSQKIEVLIDGDKRKFIVCNDVSTVTLEISDIEKLIGSNKPAKKLLVLSLIKLNEQAYSDGALRRNYIQFPLKEMVDIGFYSTPQAARIGFASAMDSLTDIKVKGELHKGNKKTEEQYVLEMLFTGGRIKNGVCTVFINERINWAFIAAFYTILPKYYFKLSNRASDLLYYIFYLARQNVKKIEQQGYFTISMRAIQNRLGLPDKTKTKNPQRDIIDAIEGAISDIEEASKDLEFLITPVYDKNASIADYLSNGYIKISLSGHYALDFINLSKETEKKLKDSRKRQEAIVDRAKEKALVKKLEEENADKKED